MKLTIIDEDNPEDMIGFGLYTALVFAAGIVFTLACEFGIDHLARYFHA